MAKSAWHVKNATYVPDRKGIELFATTAPRLGAYLKALSEVAEEAARDNGPKQEDDFDGYRLHFENDLKIADIPYRRNGAYKMKRQIGVVANTSRLAVLVEVGSYKSDPYRALARALRDIKPLVDDVRIPLPRTVPNLDVEHLPRPAPKPGKRNVIPLLRPWSEEAGRNGRPTLPIVSRTPKPSKPQRKGKKK